MKHYMAILGASLLLSSCKPAHILVNPKPIEVEWIAGTWKHRDKEYYEKWVRIADDHYGGVAYDLLQGYATLHEKMRIFRDGEGSWFFEARVAENEYKPILFRWIPDPEVELKFANASHDFPQQVMYRKEAFDVMTATISKMDGSGAIHSEYMRYTEK